MSTLTSQLHSFARYFLRAILCVVASVNTDTLWSDTASTPVLISSTIALKHDSNFLIGKPECLTPCNYSTNTCGASKRQTDKRMVGLMDR